MDKDSAVGAAMIQASSLIEGGLFYPVAHVVVGFPSHEDAARVQQALLENDLRQTCVLVSASAMVEAAEKDLESEGVIAAFGSTGQIREKQLQLAREGCHFLMVKVSSEQDKALLLKALVDVPVRYAVHYRTLVVEDLIAHIPSATRDRESARTS